MIEFFKFAISSAGAFFGTFFLLVLILGIPFGTISSAISSWADIKWRSK